MQQQSLPLSSNILIVDDDSTMRMTLKAVVESTGHRAVALSSAEEAIEYLKSHKCRIIISDWEMPGMNGLEFCAHVRKMNLGGYVYFMLLTSNDTSDHLVKGLESGADDFIAKPFNPAVLRAKLRNAHRIESLDTMDITIFVLAKLAESRDPETGEHLDRVRAYVQVLARAMKQTQNWPEIDEQFIHLMYSTSPLHDIGKVAIPDSVLLKPGHLNDSEFEIMKSHASAGANTLLAALDRFPNHPFLQIAHDITRSHHERYDGSGYPDGLVGEDIPLAARIMAIADVYDALTSKRVYKDAFTHQVACNIIRESAGTHFDPQLCLIFERISSKFEEIRMNTNDTVQIAA